MLSVMMFKKEILEKIKNYRSPSKWKSVEGDAYSTDMIKYPFFVVDTEDTRYHKTINSMYYTIVKPEYLNGYVVNKKHVEPYLPDEVFEWLEE